MAGQTGRYPSRQSASSWSSTAPMRQGLDGIWNPVSDAANGLDGLSGFPAVVYMKLSLKICCTTRGTNPSNPSNPSAAESAERGPSLDLSHLIGGQLRLDLGMYYPLIDIFVLFFPAFLRLPKVRLHGGCIQGLTCVSPVYIRTYHKSMPLIARQLRTDDHHQQLPFRH